MSRNLADRYHINRTLRVPELNVSFEITGAGTPMIRKNGGLQKVGHLRMKKVLQIDYEDHTISCGFWNDATGNFDYSIRKQEPA